MDASEKYNYTKTTVKQKKNDAPLEIQTYTPSNEPFVYSPGSNVLDIIRQSNRQQTYLQDQERLAKRNAKIAAYTDFFKSLGQLAGGGDAPVAQYQPSPYLQKAFKMIDDYNNQKYQYQSYYDKMYQTAVQKDYANKYTEYKDARTAKDKAGIAAVDASNKGAIEKFRANTTEVSQVQEDPRKMAKEAEYKERTLKIQQQNADSNAARASDSRRKTDAYIAKGGASTKAPFLSYKKKDGAVITLDKSQATQVINDILKKFSSLSEKPEKELTDLEKEIVKDMSMVRQSFNSSELNKNDNLLRAVAMKYLEADKNGEFNYIFQQAPVQPVTQPVQNTPTKAQGAEVGTFFQSLTASKPSNYVEKRSASPSLLPK